jgi:hypothetical protein
MTTDMGTRASRTLPRPAQRPDQADPPTRQDTARRGVHPPGRRPPGLPSGPPSSGAAGGPATGTRLAPPRPAAPGTRPRRPGVPGTAPRPGPPRPAPRQAQSGQAQAGRAQAGQAQARIAAPASGATKTRFILLVIGLLAGGLICLLVINTTLAAAAFRITALQNGNAALSQQKQELQQKVAEEKSASSLERRARALGMRPQARPNFLNLRTGKIFRSPHSLPGVPSVPGYAP